MDDSAEKRHTKTHSPVAEVAVTFLRALFSESDIILVRPIETWTEEGRKRSRVDYQNTCHLNRAGLSSAFPRLLKLAEKNFLNLFFGVCPRYGDKGRFDLAWQIRTVASSLG